MLYRTLYTVCPLPKNHWDLSEIPQVFLSQVPFLYYIDCLKYSIFSKDTSVPELREIYISSDFYSNRKGGDLEEQLSQAEKTILEMLMRERNPRHSLALLLDLYIRFKDYNFLEKLLIRIMNMPLKYIDSNNKIHQLDMFKFTLLWYYLDSVDMDLDVAKSTTAIERYIRIINLLNSQALSEYAITSYAIVDLIYKKTKISQFEKPFQKESKRSSF